MAHIAKYNKGAMGHMLSHYDRSKDGLGENIDTERSCLNYNLAEQVQPMKQLDYIHKRLSEVHCQNRKDVNILCDWVITAPRDLPVHEYGAFFQGCYNFLLMRYGAENVVSAYVHMDETTPHMHYAFLPVARAGATKEYEYKICAKQVVTRRDLQTFHQDLQKYVERALGHNVGILNDATKEGNRSIEELKRQSATERLQEATAEASKIVSKAQSQAQAVNNSLVSVQAEYEAKKAYVRQADKIADVSMMYPPEVRVIEKGMINKQKYAMVPVDMWEARHVAAHEKDYLQEANNALEDYLQEFRSTTSARHLAALSQRVEELERQNADLRSKLIMAERDVAKIENRIASVLYRLPDEMAERFSREWNALDRSRGRGR